ncbi:MAG: sensor domain-containing diguanylate cyclase [Firmicutes bacterium]|nr:sensor domain-containing diguanylate cyclase [Bacillota bacterium]
MNISQLAVRLMLALAVLASSWYATPAQQLFTGVAGGVLLLVAVKPQSRLAAFLDVVAASVLQVYSPMWLPLSAWVIAVHRGYARSLAFLLIPAPFIYAWRADNLFVWWAVLFGMLWLYLGFTLAERTAYEEESDLMLPLPDALREQWEQEREAHRQLRYQYQELVGAHRQQMARHQLDRARLQVLQTAVTTKELDDFARQILFILRDATGAPEGALWLFDEYTSSLRLAHATTRQDMLSSVALSPSAQVTRLSPSDVGERLNHAVQSLGENTLTSVLHDEQGLVGAIALFGWQDVNDEALVRERLQQMRNTVCLAIRTAHYLRTLQQENRTLSALYEIGRLSAVSSSTEDAAKKFTSVVADLLSAPFVTLYLRNPDTGTLQVVASVGEPIRLMEEQPPEANEGIAGWIARRAQPLYLPHTSSEPRLIGYASRRVFASLIGAPLMVRGQAEAVLLAAHTTPGYFREHHLEQLVSAANHFAQVIEMSRLTRSVGLLALTDGLTGLFNRRYMDIRLEEEISRSQRYHRRFSLILADVDHFKQINDTWGHATGDLVLQGVSRLLVENLRETELVFRYGGEEFLVILPEAALAQATSVAQRLREVIERHPFQTVDGSSILHVTFSAGVAEYPTHGTDKSTLLAAADQALYLAKQRGRNRVELLPPAA